MANLKLPWQEKLTKNEKEILKKLQRMGRFEDSILAHISPSEAMLLKATGGSGTTNPRTGLMEFFDPITIGIMVAQTGLQLWQSSQQKKAEKKAAQAQVKVYDQQQDSLKYQYESILDSASEAEGIAREEMGLEANKFLTEESEGTQRILSEQDFAVGADTMAKADKRRDLGVESLKESLGQQLASIMANKEERLGEHEQLSLTIKSQKETAQAVIDQEGMGKGLLMSGALGIGGYMLGKKYG